MLMTFVTLEKRLVDRRIWGCFVPIDYERKTLQMTTLLNGIDGGPDYVLLGYGFWMTG